MPRSRFPSGARLIEFDELVTADGERFVFHDAAGRFTIAFSGYGLPPISYKTQKGPFQHGASVVDWLLDPRILTLIHRRVGCTRQEYWDARNDLLDHLRPNRQSTVGGLIPHQLWKIRPDGSIRAICVFPQAGPIFEARTSSQGWDEVSYTESLQFIAHDPIFFDPVQQTVTFTPASFSELEFPIEFPIEFGDGSIDQTVNVTYAGTWVDYPTIEIDGPIAGPRITNNATGEFLQLNHTVVLGETVTIDLNYGVKTVNSDMDGDIVGKLSTDSDLATFALHPDPLAANGLNVIRVTGGSVDPNNTEVRVLYNNRYIGI